MTKFVFCDLHIGHEAAQYSVMDQAISYVLQKAKPGDEILGLGDWFHIDERGFDLCIQHPQTVKFRDLARHIKTNLVPGNHDDVLEQYCTNPSPDNPVNPINIIKPFGEDGIWYCHGHEYDPACEKLRWFQKLLSHLEYLMYLMRSKPPQLLYAGLSSRRTPGSQRGDSITERDLALGNWVHSRALLGLQEKGSMEGQKYKGIVLGHTHIPLQQEYAGQPFLVNGGDMRHSSTFVVKDDDGLHLMQWDSGQSQWRLASTVKP